MNQNVKKKRRKVLPQKLQACFFLQKKNYFLSSVNCTSIGTVHSDGARYIKLRSMPVIPYKIIDNRFSQGESCV